MATRRPIVSVAGKNRQLPSGDSLAGLPVYVPAYQTSGTALKLALTASYGLVAFNSAGAGLNIQVVLNG